MDPKGRLSSQIHFLVPLGITYSDALHCGNTLSETNLLLNCSNECVLTNFFILVNFKSNLFDYFP